MGMTSALKLRSIVDLAENLFAIELLAGAEGLEHRRPLKGGHGVERAFAAVRKIAPPLTQDRALSGILRVLLKRFGKAILIQERITHEWKANHPCAARHVNARAKAGTRKPPCGC